jgi:GntR family transcriptional regulator/MocR family aminotransferase
MRAGSVPSQTWRWLTARELRASAFGRNPGQVTLTSGTQQAFDLIARVLLVPGERAAVEDPGYAP